MINYFPKYFTNRAVSLYFITLILVSIAFYQFHMEFIWFAWGIVEVLLFFIMVPYIIKNWNRISPKQFERRLFWTTFTISLIYTIFTYFLYTNLRGEPFEYDPTDGLGYHEEAMWFVEMFKQKTPEIYWKVFSETHDFSDRGYLIYLDHLYLLTNSNIFITRVLKCFYHALLCVLIYRIGKRNFGEGVGRMAAVFCIFMPQIIFYNCSHRKEMEMILISTLCLERMDMLLHSKHYNFKSIIAIILLMVITFSFRTVLGISLIFALVSALLLSPANLMNKRKKWFIMGWGGLLFVILAGGHILNEVTSIWDKKMGDTYEGKSMEWRSTVKGSDGRANEYAKYAGAAVFAPVVVVFPFTTLVTIADQENQQRLNGGYFIKNFMGLFVLIALFRDIKSKRWKNSVMLYTFTFSYLGMLALSEFAQSERFHLPVLPFLLIFSAYGISIIQNKDRKWVPWYLFFIFIANFVWNWFKLSGRGYV